MSHEARGRCRTNHSNPEPRISTFPASIISGIILGTALPNLFEGGGTRTAAGYLAHGSCFAGKGHRAPRLAVPPVEMSIESNGPPLRCRRSAPAGRRATGAAFWLCLALLFAAPCAFAVAPGANRVEARLLTPISTYSSKPGATVEAVITTPLCQQGASLPEGTTVQGCGETSAEGGAWPDSRDRVPGPRFRDLAPAEWNRLPAPIRLVGIDNARERIDGRGEIHGMRATATHLQPVRRTAGVLGVRDIP